MSRRVVFRKFGEVSVLEIESFTPPTPGPGQIEIAVRCCGVNFADALARRGFYKWAPPLPTCVGFEVSGVVSRVGSAVTEFVVGDPVLAITKFGGYAEHVVIDANRAFSIPEGMSFEHAAALPAVYLTAWHSLEEVARMRAGESILIQAVAGGVGLAALQLAKIRGLTTYGTASTDAKLALAKEHGLDFPINYTTHDFEREIRRLTHNRGVDIVLDSLGGEGLRKGYRCLARGGQVITIGAAQVAPKGRFDVRSLVNAAVELAKGGVFHPFELIEDNRGVAGVQVLLLWDDLPRVRRGIDTMLRLYSEGLVKPHVDSVVALEQAGKAHLALEGRKTSGKVLLRP